MKEGLGFNPKSCSVKFSVTVNGWTLEPYQPKFLTTVLYCKNTKRRSIARPSPYIYIYIYLSLSLSLSLSFFSLFLPSCLYFLLSCGSLFLSLSLFFGLLCFVSWKEQQNIQLQSFFHQSFLFWGVSCFVFSLKSLLLSLLFPDFKLRFCSTSMFLVSRNTSWKTPISSRGGLQQNAFFCLWTYVLQNVKKLSLFLGHFWLMFKKHYKNRYFSTLLEAIKSKNDHFYWLWTGPSKGY